MMTPKSPASLRLWITLVLLAPLAVSSPAWAYDFGSLPGGVTADVGGWRSSYVRDCPDGSKRVDDGTGNTVSEGIGYGMLIAALSGDADLFGGLWQYYQARKNIRGLMNWKYQGCSTDPVDFNGASDADLDVAMALILGEEAFPGNGYGTDAGWQIEILRQNNFDDCGGRIVLRPGDSSGFSGCDCANPSYFAPGYYRAFAAFTPMQAAFWNQAADDAYAVLADNQHPSSGLVSAWSTSTGQPVMDCDVAVAGGGNPGDYQYDAARVPWRIALDYAWHGSADAQSFLAPMIAWVKQSAGLPNNVGDLYSKSGNRQSENRNSVFMGGFASGAVIDPGDVATLTSAWQGGPYLGGDGAYYTKSLQVLYALFLSDQFTEPGVTCTPEPCGTRVCGTDGCGGSCGMCENGEACSREGTCGCPPPELPCGGVCVDPRSTDEHCGGCDMPCPFGLHCSARVCASNCTVLGTRDCGGGCIDILADVTNCGGCGTVCPAEAACTQGQCTDPEGEVVIPEMTMDPAPMGSQTPAQEPGAAPTCSGDQCLSCPQDFTLCGTICSRTATDVENCGGCGNACAAGQTCSAGVCTAASSPSQGNVTTSTDSSASDSSGCAVSAPGPRRSDAPSSGAVGFWGVLAAASLWWARRRRLAAG